MKQVLLLLFLLPFSLFSQEIVGRVTDIETKEPIPFAQLKIEGIVPVMANENGEFSIKLESFPATCIISALDYYADTITITSNRIEACNLNTGYRSGSCCGIAKTTICSGVDDFP